MRRTTRKASIFLIAFGLVAAACGSSSSGDSSNTSVGITTTSGGSSGSGGTSPTTADAGTPKKGGRIVISAADEADLGLAPWSAVTDVGGASVATAIYDTLAAFNDKGEAVPFLAESITPNADATVWDVKLRDGIKFSDGSDLTSSAIVYMMDQDVANGRVIQEGFKVEATDRLTARFTFLQPYVAFPASMASQWAWVTSDTAAKSMGDDFRNNPVGTGPYMMKEWVRNDHMTLVRNPNYWRKDLPYADEIVYRPIADDAARRAALLAGDVDAIVVGAADIATMRKNNTVKMYETESGVGALCYNVDKPGLSDLRVRQALSYAIDVKAVIDTVYDGVGTPATGPLAHGNPFYKKVTVPTYDPGKATSLLKEYKDATGNDVSIEFSFGQTPVDQELAQLLQSYWQAVGVNVTLAAPANTGDLQTKRAEHQFDVVTCGVDAVFDPDVWLALFRSDSFLNYSDFKDAEIDKAVDDSRSSVAKADRVDAYARLQQRMADQLPWFFLSEAVLAVAAKPSIHGLDKWTLPDGSAGTSKQFWLPFTADALWVSS